jgi:hypothetical protein
MEGFDPQSIGGSYSPKLSEAGHPTGDIFLDGGNFITVFFAGGLIGPVALQYLALVLFVVLPGWVGGVI